MHDPSAVESAAIAGDAGRSLRHGVARAAFASGIAETATRVLTIVLSIATARALLPGQVGILGLAVIVVGIVSLIAACSETAGIIGRYEGTDSQHAFASTVVRGCIVAILVTGVYLGLPMITRALAGAEAAEPELVRLVGILLWLPVLELAGNYPRVLLQRRLDLIYLAGVGLLHVSFHVGFSVVLLWQGFGAMGVAWSSIVAAMLSGLAVWFRLMGPRRPKWAGLPNGNQRLKSLVETSKVFAGSFVGYLNGRVDNLLVAGALGPTAMGFYGMAWSASRIAPQILGQALGFVLVPTLAQIQADKERVRRALNESLQHSYLLLAPLAAGLFVAAPSLVVIVLGANWLPMVPCLRIMSVAMLASPLITGSNALLVATGRGHIAGVATLGQLTVLATVIVPLSKRWGILGAACGDLFAVSALTIALLAVTPSFRRTLKAAILTSALVPVVAALIAGLIAWTVTAQPIGPALKLLAQSGVLLVGYPAILSLLGGKAALVDLLTLVRNVSRRVGAAPTPSHT